jgi:hypothetical protein
MSISHFIYVNIIFNFEKHHNPIIMKNILILVLMILTNTLFSQEIKVTRDIGLWIGLDFKKKYLRVLTYP